MLLHTEYSMLSLLHTQDGVVHHHGLFQVSDLACPLHNPPQLVLVGLHCPVTPPSLPQQCPALLEVRLGQC